MSAVTRAILNAKVWAENLVGGAAIDYQQPTDQIIADGWNVQGIKPKRAYHNWLINALASGLAFFENQGFFEWDATIEYEPNAIVMASNGTLYIGKTAANLNNDPVSDGSWTDWEPLYNFLYPASVDITRPRFFAYESSTQIDLLGPGSYPLYGVGRVGFYGAISYDFTSLSDGFWTYLYIDASTVTGPGIITSANLTDSSVAPIYDDSKGGWYNGDDLCIFAVYGAIAGYLYFSNTGDFVSIGEDSDFGVLGVAVIGGSPTLNVQLNAPAFTSRFGATLSLIRNGADSVLFVRPSGINNTGRRVTAVTTVSAFSEIPTDGLSMSSSQQIDIVGGSGANALLDIFVYSWFFPKGM